LSGSRDGRYRPRTPRTDVWAFLERTDLRNPRRPLRQWLEELPEPTLTMIVDVATRTGGDTLHVLGPVIQALLLRERPTLERTGIPVPLLREAYEHLFVAVLAEHLRRITGRKTLRGDVSLTGIKLRSHVKTRDLAGVVVRLLTR
jgi:hypothetical protein